MSFIRFSKGCKRLKPADYCKSKQSSRRSSRSRKSSRRSSRGKKKRCARPGKVTKNPFFNFLREFRKQHCGWSITKVAVEGAKIWCSMDPKTKEKFYKEACGQMGGGRGGKVRSRHGRGKSRRSRSKSRRGKFRSCPCKGSAGKKRSRSRGSRRRVKSSGRRNSKCL